MFVIERVFRDEERHEALVDCRPEEGAASGAGKSERHRITVVDCDRLGLAPGVLLSEEAYALLLEAKERLACVQKAFSHLSYGDLSRKRQIGRAHV